MAPFLYRMKISLHKEIKRQILNASDQKILKFIKGKIRENKGKIIFAVPR
jgi:hypothetical protein